MGLENRLPREVAHDFLGFFYFGQAELENLVGWLFSIIKLFLILGTMHNSFFGLLGEGQHSGAAEGVVFFPRFTWCFFLVSRRLETLPTDSVACDAVVQGRRRLA
jgi:hypothetical protein